MSAAPRRPEHHDDLCESQVSPTVSRRNILRAATVLAVVGAAGVGGGPTSAMALPAHGGGAGARRDLTWYQLVPGGVDVVSDPWGRPAGTGFAAPNPWGAYTAFLVHVSAAGQRTWRVENMALTAPRADGSQYAQGSTMWLFDGAQRALLVDTAQSVDALQSALGQSPVASPTPGLVARTAAAGETEAWVHSPA